MRSVKPSDIIKYLQSLPEEDYHIKCAIDGEERWVESVMVIQRGLQVFYDLTTGKKKNLAPKSKLLFIVEEADKAI